MRKQEALRGHEQVYHATPWRQAASLSLTPQRLRGKKKPCPPEGKKERGLSLFCQSKRSKRAWEIASNAPGMCALSGLKGFRLIARLANPHAVHNPNPDISQGAQSHAVGFAFRQFALIIRSGQRFRERRLPGELVQIIAPRFHTGKAFVRPGIIAALVGDGSRASQHLDTAGIGVPRAIIAPFEPRRRGARRLPARGRELQISWSF